MMILALIGVGRWGRNYLKTVQDIPNSRIKYICASSKKSLAEFPNTYVKVANYKELTQYKDIDGVIIATPASTHFQIIKELVSKDKNLLVEKPFVASCAQARKVQKMVRGKSVTVMIGHTYLYNPAFHTVLSLRGKIGEIRYVEFEFCDSESLVSDVSALWAWAPHPISMSLAILDAVPIDVYAWYIQVQRKRQFFPEVIYAKLRFSNGVDVCMKLGWLSPLKRHACVIVGTKGSIILDDVAERKLNLHTIDEKTTYPFYLKKAPLMVELEEFIRCIINKDKPKTDIVHGLQVTQIIHVIEKALITGKRQVFRAY